MAWRGGGLPKSAISSEAVDGQSITPGNSLRGICTKQSVSPHSGRRLQVDGLHSTSGIYLRQLDTKRMLAAIITVMTFGRSAAAQDFKRGEALLARNCASCHAVGRTGDSPQKLAPTFRSLGQRYPIESLEEALGEGIMSGHPDMPEFSFDAADVGAIIAYLNSIQQR